MTDEEGKIAWAEKYSTFGELDLSFLHKYFNPPPRY
ncbi:hypothetical protein [Photorhabdus sp. SF281]